MTQENGNRIIFSRDFWRRDYEEQHGFGREEITPTRGPRVGEALSEEAMQSQEIEKAAKTLIVVGATGLTVLVVGPPVASVIGSGINTLTSEVAPTVIRGIGPLVGKGLRLAGKTTVEAIKWYGIGGLNLYDFARGVLTENWSLCTTESLLGGAAFATATAVAEAVAHLPSRGVRAFGRGLGKAGTSIISSISRRGEWEFKARQKWQ